MRHSVVRTPIDILNILGAGGIKRGSIFQAWGPPKVGKSTFCYQSASMDMMDNEDSVTDIIDPENSTDLIRLRDGFKLDMDRVTIHHLRTLEDAFKLIIDHCDMMVGQRIGKIKNGRKELKILAKSSLLKMDDKDFFKYCEQFEIPIPPTLENGISYTSVPIVPEDYDNDRSRMMKALARAGAYKTKDGSGMIPRNIIWDTIAVSRPQAEYEKIAEGNLDKNAAGMNVHAQVVSQKLSAVLSSMGGKDLTLFLPNQIRNKAKRGGMPGYELGSAGSFALEHNCHYICEFKRVNNKDSREKNYDEDDAVKTGSDFKMTIEKSKFGASLKNICLYINDKKGGIIIAKEELAWLALEIGVMTAKSGWYTIKGHEESLGKLRWGKEASSGTNYVSGNPEIRKILIEEVARHYRTNFMTLNSLYEECGRGELGRPREDELNTEEDLEDDAFLESMSEGF